MLISTFIHFSKYLTNGMIVMSLILLPIFILSLFINFPFDKNIDQLTKALYYGRKINRRDSNVLLYSLDIIFEKC